MLEMYLFLDLVGGGAGKKRRIEYGSNLASLETESELNQTVDPHPLRRLYKLQVKISGHIVTWTTKGN